MKSSNVFFECVLKAFQETIAVFQQKNETFKTASREVGDEVSVSAVVKDSSGIFVEGIDLPKM